MNRILITYEKKDNTVDINLEYFSKLFLEMGSDYRIVKSSKVADKDLRWCDVCLSNRPSCIYSQKIAEFAEKNGIFYIASFDDDLLNLPKKNHNNWKRKYMISCLKKSRALISTSPLILNEYSSYCSNAKLILSNAFVEESELKPMHDIDDIIRIVFPAGADHLPLFNQFIKPIISDIFDQFSGRVDMTFIGIEPDFNNFKYKDSLHFVKPMSYEKYKQYMQTHNFDVGIAPLSKTSFNERKYFVKYIEYSKYGILGLYSDTYPYKYIVENNENGILVPDSSDAWKNAMVRVMNDHSIIIDIIKRSQAHLREHFTIQSESLKILSICPEISSYSKSVIHKKKYNKPIISTLLYNFSDFVRKVIYHLRWDGVKYIVEFLRNKNC